jgi:hypothetical protein
MLLMLLNRKKITAIEKSFTRKSCQKSCGGAPQPFIRPASRRSRRKSGDPVKLFQKHPVIAPAVRKHAGGAVLGAGGRVSEIAAALVAEGVEGAVAKQAVEFALFADLVAWKILALSVLEKRKVLVFPVGIALSSHRIKHLLMARAFPNSIAAGLFFVNAGLRALPPVHARQICRKDSMEDICTSPIFRI